jgi:protein-S-isoprenylcysteine O-methyltransferase Ste14
MPVPFALLGFGLLYWLGPQFPRDWQRPVAIIALLAIGLGHLIRYWALGHAGVTTRSVRLQAPYLTTTGPYAYVRNPLYVGNFLIGIGCTLYLQQPWLLPLYPLLFWAQYGIIVPLEEEFLAGKFGEEYERYRAGVRRYWPRLTPYPSERRRYDWSILLSKEWWAILASVAVVGLTHLTLWAREQWLLQ